MLESPLVVGVLLFLLFGVLTRYWRYYLPGGRRMFPLPDAVPETAHPESLRACEPAAELVRHLSDPRQGPRAQKHLSPDQKDALALALIALRGEVSALDLQSSAAGVEAIDRILHPTPSARTRQAIRQGAALVR